MEMRDGRGWKEHKESVLDKIANLIWWNENELSFLSRLDQLAEKSANLNEFHRKAFPLLEKQNPWFVDQYGSIIYEIESDSH